MTKKFLSNDGLFELNYPINWQYEYKDNDINEFFRTDGIGALHLSVLLEENAKSSYYKVAKSPISKKRMFGSNIAYELLIENSNKFCIINWLMKVQEHIILITFTYPNKYNNSQQVNDEIEIIYKIISSLHIIELSNRKRELSWYRFNNFLQGLGASEELLNRASKNGSFIESVCILANQIDAMLRVAIILFTQIELKSTDIDISLIYQGKKDKPIFEKDIYRLAKEKNIIDASTYEELFKIYNERNRVIHRYIISEITTKYILYIALRYSNLKGKIHDIVYNLECKQIDSGVGITRTDYNINKEQISESLELFNKLLKTKHGDIDFNE